MMPGIIHMYIWLSFICFAPLTEKGLEEIRSRSWKRWGLELKSHTETSDWIWTHALGLENNHVFHFWCVSIKETLKRLTGFLLLCSLLVTMLNGECLTQLYRVPQSSPSRATCQRVFLPTREPTYAVVCLVGKKTR